MPTVCELLELLVTKSGEPVAFGVRKNMLKLLLRRGRSVDFLQLLDKLLQLNRVLLNKEVEQAQEVHLPAWQREIDRMRV